MSVVLYRAGTGHTVKGIECEVLLCNENSFLHNLDNGWFLEPGEWIVETPKLSFTLEPRDEYEEMSIKELRKKAKEINPKVNNHTHRTKLIRIIRNDNQG